MNTEYHEQLSEQGTAFANLEDDTPTVRVIPIREGERARGFRPDNPDDDAPAIWDREPLEDAIEQGTLADLDGSPTKIVKGEGGKNPHFPLDEQVPPENILGKIDHWEYEDGVGPVGYAKLADEDIASRVDLGLLDISGDWYRRLGEFDEERNGKPVEEVVALPRVTVLDRGGSNASIESAEAEALAHNPDYDNGMVELLQQVGDAVRWESDSGGDREPPDVRYGVVINALPDGDDDEVLVSVYQANPDYDGWENRTDDELPMNTDTLEVVGSDGVESLPPVSQVFDTEQNAETDPEQNAPSDERADTRAGSESQDQQPSDTTQTMSDDDLREQLSQAQGRVETLEEKKEQLAEENDDLEEQLADAESERDDLEDEKESLEDEIEQLRDDLGPIKQIVADIAAADSKLSGEQLADRFEGGELIESIADEDDDRSPAEQVREQLAAGVDPRGESSDEEPEQFTEEQLAAANDRSYEMLSGQDLRQIGDQEPRDYVKEQYGVDPATVDSRDELRRKAEAQGGD